MAKKLINKKIFKAMARKCAICENPDISIHHVHRIVHGENNGKYTKNNCVSLCPNCHSKVHTNQIKIIGVFYSTAGNLLHYFAENGEEIFKPI